MLSTGKRVERVARRVRAVQVAVADAVDRSEVFKADGHRRGHQLVARACRRPELLLLGALLHDIGKGRPGDHSEVGAATAETVSRRIGLDSEGREIVTWLVPGMICLGAGLALNQYRPPGAGR